MKYRRLRIDGAAYFFTLVTRDRQPVFFDAWSYELLAETFERVRVRRPFVIDAYVVLPDHLHTIWSLPDGDSDYSTRWMLIKSDFARAWSKRFGSSRSGNARNNGSPWQNRFWEHMIRDEDDFSNHIEYIHYNPVQHGKVKAPRDWPYSSFSAFVARGDYPIDWGCSEMPRLKPIDRRSE